MTREAAITPIFFSEAQAQGLVAKAAKAGVSIRASDQIFRVCGEEAIACIRLIRPWHARLCGCFVAEACRGRGYGKMLVLHRLEIARRNFEVRMVDTYAFRSSLFLSLGFEAVRSYAIGTTLLRLRTNDAS